MKRTFDYSFLQAAHWDNGIVSQLARIHEYKGRQKLYLSQRPAELGRLVELAKVQSTESSNKIEGIVTTDTRIRALVSEKTTPRNRDEAEIAGYRDVLSLIHERYEHIPLRANVILQLHRDLYRYSGRDIGGRFKNTQNYINATLPDGTSRTLFTPLEPYETPDAVEAICEQYRRAADADIVDRLLLIPVFIVDFLCIHPFNDGNGRMSRLLTTLLLYQSGYVVGRYISLEHLIEKTKETYYDALRDASADWYAGTNRYDPFIRYLLGVVLCAYREFERRVDVFGAHGNAYERVRRTALENVGGFSKRELLEQCPGLSVSAVETALKRLCNEGILRKTGSGRGTRYVILISWQEGS